MKRLYLLALLILSSALGARPAEAGWFDSYFLYKETAAIRYCRGEGLDLYLDLYQPRGAEGRRPAIVLIHGGGWGNGGRKWMTEYATELAKRGFVVANIDYRLANPPRSKDPEIRRYQVAAVFPAAVQDARCAVRWLRANAARFSVAPDRIAAVGDSAGGNLALMLGFAPDTHEFRGGDLTTGALTASSAVQAVVNLYGVPDMQEGAKLGPAEMLIASGGGVSCYRRYVGCSVEACPQRWDRASPLYYIRGGEPGVPVLTIHGTQDTIVPFSLALRLDDELARRGPYHRLVALVGVDHGFLVKGNRSLSLRYRERARREIESFLLQQMK